MSTRGPRPAGALAPPPDARGLSGPRLRSRSLHRRCMQFPAFIVDFAGVRSRDAIRCRGTSRTGASSSCSSTRAWWPWTLFGPLEAFRHGQMPSPNPPASIRLAIGGMTIGARSTRSLGIRITPQRRRLADIKETDRHAAGCPGGYGAGRSELRRASSRLAEGSAGSRPAAADRSARGAFVPSAAAGACSTAKGGRPRIGAMAGGS